MRSARYRSQHLTAGMHTGSRIGRPTAQLPSADSTRGGQCRSGASGRRCNRSILELVIEVPLRRGSRTNEMKRR